MPVEVEGIDAAIKTELKDENWASGRCETIACLPIVLAAVISVFECPLHCPYAHFCCDCVTIVGTHRVHDVRELDCFFTYETKAKQKFQSSRSRLNHIWQVLKQLKLFWFTSNIPHSSLTHLHKLSSRSRRRLSWLKENFGSAPRTLRGCTQKIVENMNDGGDITFWSTILVLQRRIERSREGTGVNAFSVVFH